MEFSDFIGHEDARLALMLNAIEPKCGGVLFAGEKGAGKSTLIRLFRDLLPADMPFVTVPLNVTEDALLGTIDIETTIRTGVKTVQKGLLNRAHNGILFIDDVNLLSEDAVSLILEISGRKENVMEREGLSERYAADFIPVAAMNPDEGVISSHFLDRFGLSVLWEGIQDKKERMLIMKKNMLPFFSGNSSSGNEGLREKILSCRIFLQDVTVPPEITDYISQICLQNAVSGHRADIFLYYAAKAYTAFCGDKKTTSRHVDAVAPLVLIHRQRRVIPPEEEKSREPEEKQNEDKNEKPQNQKNQAKSGNTEQSETSSEDLKKNNNMAAPSEIQESASKEDIFDIGETFKTKRFLFRKDRTKRTASGRRTRTRSKDKGGRYVRSILREDNDIAIDATIRAAAPYQRLRRRRDMLIIRSSDMRYKQREKKTGHLVIFAVDGSGSMGAQRRMVAAKAAIQSLLADCYQKRDKVAMILFRKDKAQLVLAPTSSVENASRQLRELPTGGKTPLTAALIETHSLIKRVSKKSPETRFLVIIITDGRANHRLSDLSINEEIRRASQLVSDIPSVDFIVVDTEEKGKFLTADLALDLAAYLDADYYTVADLKSDYLIEMVKREKGD